VFKPAHAVTLHGVLVLPALAWLLTRTGLPERQQFRLVIGATVGYALLALVALAL
jgi:hypothetical protein